MPVNLESVAVAMTIITELLAMIPTSDRRFRIATMMIEIQKV